MRWAGVELPGESAQYRPARTVDRAIFAQEEGVGQVLAVLREETCQDTPADTDYEAPCPERWLQRALLEVCAVLLRASVRPSRPSTSPWRSTRFSTRPSAGCSLLNPTEQAAVLAVTGCSLDYHLVQIAMSDQWPTLDSSSETVEDDAKRMPRTWATASTISTTTIASWRPPPRAGVSMIATAMLKKLEVEPHAMRSRSCSRSRVRPTTTYPIKQVAEQLWNLVSLYHGSERDNIKQAAGCPRVRQT